mmetsp:Transcript_14109/g.17104  ORF Transcript_14109/g.17104 Transcript_14109/m.17104 type:complete len:132 (-) Transcript_14109:412-807(-)|eukprot:CAMPEP_0197854392 /NCGR_PEP_ID=MMETSP1438-20131217/24588_1 /TAXON_ID=1461541 /ORGANISM="Pterosperma sp., Strain CCMP1384" /LENGTH=131 /DNA_ID=CAMNT_0043469109 /DNA_START=80 /DNA_END=475 /DNA_ORIENTATION=+
MSTSAFLSTVPALSTGRTGNALSKRGPARCGAPRKLRSATGLKVYSSIQDFSQSFSTHPQILDVREVVTQVAAACEDTGSCGAVEAPVSAIAIGAVVVTAAALASTFLLKPGFDAADEMQARDKKVFGKKK